MILKIELTISILGVNVHIQIAYTLYKDSYLFIWSIVILKVC